MSKIYEPTLSEKAYIESPGMILGRVLSCYILTDGRQSLLFKDQIKSMPVTFANHRQSPMSFADKVKIELGELLRLRFEYVEIEAEVKIENDSKATAIIYGSVIGHDGKTYGLGYISEYDPTGFKIVQEINNYGDGLGYLRGL